MQAAAAHGVGGSPANEAISSHRSVASEPAGVVWTIAFAAWCGIATGLGEVAITAAQELGFHALVRQSREFVWMTPAADLVLFLALSCPVAIAAAVLPRWLTRRLVATLFVSIGTLALLLYLPRLSTIAQVLLAVGVGVQVGRRLAASSWRFGRQALALGGLVAIVGVGARAVRGGVERRAIATLPQPPAGGANVLLLILDTVHAGRLSLYGYERRTTPNLERWAREGVVFDRAYSTTSWTLPSHATMFTGRYPWELSTSWRTPLDREYPTLAEVLRNRGYMTGGFVANMTYAGHDSGLDRGFIRYDDFVATPRQLSWSASFAQTPMGIQLREARTLRALAGTLRRFNLQIPPIKKFVRKPAPVVTAEFLDWQARHPDQRFFAFLNYFDAHKTYQLPAAFARRFSASGRARDVYDGAIAYIDQSVDSLLTELDRRGVLNNTLVVITADHGEYFGQHGIATHEDGLHSVALHVPLVILARGRAPAGVRVPDVVSLRDLPATLLEVAGVGGDELPGHSLAAEWTAPTGTPSRRSPVVAGLEKSSWIWAFVSDDLYWIRGLRGQEELYERSDTAEVRNLAADSSARSRLRAAMTGVTIGGFPKP